jgi:AcrR family transcriptional regulator
MTTSPQSPSGAEQEDSAAVATTSPAPRPLRRDAERNRRRILKAADEVFTERGLEATLDDVARHAGVGVGTVYRRFPDKASLADALFEQRVDAILDLATQAHNEPDSWLALTSFLQRAAEMLSGDRGLRQILMFAASGHNRVAYARDRMRPAVDRLLKRAQAEGKVRDDLSATDIPVIEFMLGSLTEYAGHVRPTIWRRYLVLMMDALRPARDSFSPLPEPALTPDEMLTAMHSSPLGRHLATKSASVKNQPTPPEPPTAPGNTQ